MPSLWKEEYANVIAKLARKVDRPLKEVMEHYEFVCEELHSYERVVDPSHALQIALNDKINIYDAHYVLLALQLNVKLITEDIELLKKCPRYAQNMLDFTS